MVLQAIVWTVLAWFAGLLLDANLSLQPAGFLCLRVLLPILAMGLCILREIRQNRDQCMEQSARGFPRALFCGLSEARSGRQMRRLTKR